MPCNPKHLRKRAEELRAIAEDMTDVEPKERLFRLAEEYEKLAEKHEPPR